ncbi:MAG: PH domain-containing protein [Acidimicrobiia bacterium]
MTQVYAYGALGLSVYWSPSVFTSDLYSTRDRWLLALAIVGLLAVRVAIATDWVEATSSGLTWRSIFVRRHLPWSDITSLQLGEPTNSGIHGHAPDALRVNGPRFIGGHFAVHTSIQCRNEAIEDFIAAATELRLTAMNIET